MTVSSMVKILSGARTKSDPRRSLAHFDARSGCRMLYATWTAMMFVDLIEDLEDAQAETNSWVRFWKMPTGSAGLSRR